MRRRLLRFLGEMGPAAIDSADDVALYLRDNDNGVRLAALEAIMVISSV